MRHGGLAQAGFQRRPLHATTAHAAPPATHHRSQSLSQSYGSILPTSLTYIILSTRGCTPWRPAAVISTISHKGDSFPWIFTGRQGCSACSNCHTLLRPSPLRQLNCFQGQRTHQEEETTLPRTPADVSRFMDVAEKAP
jgi:hypothetical protein